MSSDIDYYLTSNFLSLLLFISIFFFGRICIEVSIIIESTVIDKFIKNNKHIQRYEEDLASNDRFNNRWYKYLILNDKKAAYNLIDHMVDRMLFLLSTSVASLVFLILSLILLKMSVSNLLIVVLVIGTYTSLAFFRSRQLAQGLDIIRYLLTDLED
jgi:ABC-type multidrug transport system fused ATPase/permease subunit